MGVSNCLFHFQYYDNLEGVVISSQSDTESGVNQLNDNIYQNFVQASQRIKKNFDNARKIKVNSCAKLLRGSCNERLTLNQWMHVWREFISISKACSFYSHGSVLVGFRNSFTYTAGFLVS